MRTLVKVLVALGVVLPLGAYVAGSLAAVGADDPGPRQTIVISDSPSRSAHPHVEHGPSGRPSADDHGGPEVVTPSLDDLGDDHGGDRTAGRGGGTGGGTGSGTGARGGDGSGSSGSSGGSGRGSGGSHGSDDSGGGGHG